MGIDYRPLVTESLATQIAGSIRDAISDGRLAVDERLPTEEELAAQFSVSRPTVREALKRLAAQHLIRSRRGPAGGTFVNKPSQEELRTALTTAATLLISVGEFGLRDVAQARTELELVCCRLAAHNRQESHLAAMAAELEIQRRPDLGDKEFLASDMRFHRALVDACGNPVLQLVMFTVIEALPPVSGMAVFLCQERDAIVVMNERIHKAIADRDAEGAARTLKELMVYIGVQLTQAQEWRRLRDQKAG